jgi:type IX secretion system PorP/SprF family membrane protein
MMRSVKQVFAVVILCWMAGINAFGQSIHFSQYYNAPQLLNPANTALMPDYDMRAGLNYRNQWAAVPVPYNTFSAFADFKVGGNSNNDKHNNWLGIGLAFFSDKAGDGNLALNQFQGSLAYHLQLSQFTMVSLGLAGSTVQRSVDYDNLIFDAQWDGMQFNRNMTNGEKVGILKTNYYTVAAGLNFAWFPNEGVYVKLGGNLENINQPVESFYNNNKNTIAYRPIGNLDIQVQVAPLVIANPSVYYTTQKGATEIVAGSLFRTILGGKDLSQTQLILGLYNRVNDAVIGVAGIQLGPVQFMANYDFTISGLAPYNASYGALEFSLIYQRLYHPDQGIKKAFACPRFF